MECRVTQISCIAATSLAEPLKACRPQEGLKSIAPKHPGAFGGAIRRAPLREAFIPNVKILGCPEKADRATRAHRPQKVTHTGCPTRLAGP
jgi:hypothetical protein